MKKMRKLIPAFAMLLVSAIMMSTASFAWFTMNEQVTATGMNIQAQAGGSLVIKKSAGLTANDSEINVDFGETSGHLLTPMTWVSTETEKAWKKPAEGATTDSYGVTSGLTAFTPTAGTHYFDYVVYLAVAGDKIDDQILSAKVEAVANADLYIAKAYTVAFYVGTNPDAEGVVPDKLINVLNGGTSTEVKSDVDLPSTIGITTGNEVGVKVTMRVFVDGDLTKAGGTDETVVIYAPATGTYQAGTKYYTDNTGTTEVNTTSFTAQTDVSSYFVRTTTTVNHPTKYVNSKNVPLTGTVLRVTFTIAKDPNAPAAGN